MGFALRELLLSARRKGSTAAEMNPNGMPDFEERPLLADNGNEHAKQIPGKTGAGIHSSTELTRIQYLSHARHQGSWDAKSEEGSSLKELIINQSINTKKSVQKKKKK